MSSLLIPSPSRGPTGNAGDCRPRFSFFLFDCQRSDDASSSRSVPPTVQRRDRSMRSGALGQGRFVCQETVAGGDQLRSARPVRHRPRLAAVGEADLRCPMVGVNEEFEKISAGPSKASQRPFSAPYRAIRHVALGRKHRASRPGAVPTSPSAPSPAAARHMPIASWHANPLSCWAG